MSCKLTVDNHRNLWLFSCSQEVESLCVNLNVCGRTKTWVCTWGWENWLSFVDSFQLPGKAGVLLISYFIFSLQSCFPIVVQAFYTPIPQQKFFFLFFFLASSAWQPTIHFLIEPYVCVWYPLHFGFLGQQLEVLFVQIDIKWHSWKELPLLLDFPLSLRVGHVLSKYCLG